MKKLLSLIVISVFAMSFAFASGQSDTAAGEKEVVEINFSSVSVPGDAHTEAMTVFKEELEKISNGTMLVNVYHSGQLYSQEGEQAAVRQGTVDMVYTSAPWLAEFVPYLSMFSAVYTFQGYDHMTNVFNGEIGDKVFQDVVDSQGIRPLGAYYLGTRQLNLVEKVGPVRTPEDMSGVKLRTPGSPSWIALGKALGGNPTPMSFGEVYMGLKTGAVEGQDNPLGTDKNAKFYEVTKYIVLTNHVVDSTWPTINEKKWQSFSDEQKGWVLAAVDKSREFCDKTNLETEAGILDFFRGEGMIIIEDPDVAAFAEYAKNSYMTESKDISADWDWDLYDKVQGMVK
ncbi:MULTISPECIES: sialic acid TRAP transporter substrate-binding protein SiaP [unclassified Oceanispirochaeta]|uniref:sialic acid TRAP transporter substrate-binding protein SiaP n=1 Tax=unclassified Oceanispirochaeta TaxID=2635722 RepID=UPI000E09AE93|nr:MULTISPECIES: sialic acid TRAP transporter substrate-binding protein SiaP [unclassified Oceanispirochaeta]MBF9017996.1 sialic acid TRAP transporter substrate-binding protein SiaP [Oceanispirochaeta sp. M2]NPD74508.1 DctP family TRAP transporter solute-binding subunit [Oceanispirochaeta sp. M1]RDG29621.1 C4-dicarboxylate ABC transporter substrate-binding protein [Oceanispirochaeta sp. M1]